MLGADMKAIDGDPGVGAHREGDKDELIRQLQEAIRARDEFVAIAAHELRNPMTPILMQVQILLRTAKNPQRCKADVLIPKLEVLEEAIQEFVRRSTVLLETSRIASENVRIDATHVNASDIVRRVAERASLTARMAKCSLRVDVQSDVEGYWDRVALEQITENLLSNALKFGAGKPVFVGLQADASTAHIIVRDNGIGISERDRERIFGRFERAVTQREHGGFGVGLWLTQRLTAAMGGNIAIHSEPGQGTSFTVTLPLRAIQPGDKSRDD